MTDEIEWELKDYENIRKSVQLWKIADKTALKYVIEMRRKHTEAKCVKSILMCHQYPIFQILKLMYFFVAYLSTLDRLCGLVVRVLGYRS
jgi:hypothetical protein